MFLQRRKAGFKILVMAKDVDLIKEKVDLVDFLKSYLTLTPTGRNFKAICPFHQEKTPSFFVSPERKIWHCFGCGLGGDVIKFAMLYEHLEFPEALKFLAEKAGIQIRTLNPSEQREFGVLYDLNEEAVRFYKKNLSLNEKALAYLKERGLKPEIIEEFNLGFAPYGEELVKFLIKNGHDIRDIARAGLAQRNTRGLYKDKFQERIIFPISNQVGKVVAFTGRIMPDSSGKDPEGSPKYLNSPETVIFNKSKVLYGFDKSKQYVSDKNSVIIVEGQMDFLMMWQAGVKNMVAVSGTGLTEDHLSRLRRFADTVTVSFDKDKAGIKALERSLDHFHKFDFNVKVLDLGKFKDPADACRDNPEFIKTALSWSKPALSYLMDLYFGSRSYKEGGIASKKRIMRHILLKIRALRSAVEKGIWIKEASRESGIPENDLREELNDLNKETFKNEEKDLIDENDKSDKIEEVARKLTAISLTKKEFLDILKNEINLLPDNFAKIIRGDKESDDTALVELEASYVSSSLDEKTIRKEFNDLLKKLKVISMNKTKSSIKKALTEAQNSNDEEKVTNLLSQFSDISKKLNDLSK